MTWPLNTLPTITRTLEDLLPTGMPAVLVAEDSRRAWAMGNFSYWTDVFARPSAGTWHLVQLVFNRSGPTNKVYVDGSLQTLTTGTHTASGMGNFSNSSLYFMSRAANALNAAGTLDEVRLSTIERNANWVATEYNNQSLPGTFITMGSESCGRKHLPPRLLPHQPQRLRRHLHLRLHQLPLLRRR